MNEHNHGGYCPKCAEDAEALRQAEAAREAAEREGRFAAVLREHYLSAITCDHKLRIDQAVCACSRVNLGWHHHVGDAVESWIQHVLAALARPEGADDDER